ncbi:hypothetical protein KKG72_01510 [bacterium]|nr:hypothetical protein [bacterium]MBU1993359.1 hypothetical protein [bacterium]
MKSSTFYFNDEHVLYGRLRPYLNKVLLPDFEGHCSTEIFPIKPKKNILDRRFLFQWLIATETMKIKDLRNNTEEQSCKKLLTESCYEKL